MKAARAYVYDAYWSEEDEQYVGVCDAFPSLSWLADTRDESLEGIVRLVNQTLDDMAFSGEPAPAPTITTYLATQFCNGLVSVEDLWTHVVDVIGEVEDPVANEVTTLLVDVREGRLAVKDAKSRLREKLPDDSKPT